MQVQAKLRHYRMAPRKARLVTDMIKGMDVEKAISTLQVTRIKNVLRSFVSWLNRPSPTLISVEIWISMPLYISQGFC